MGYLEIFAKKGKNMERSIGTDGSFANKMKVLLLAKKTELLKELRQSQGAGIELEKTRQVTPDLLDVSSLELLITLNSTSGRGIQQNLQQVGRALERIELGQYGICLACEKKIPQKRLRAIPWAGFCADCQNKAESEQRREASLTLVPEI